MSAAKEIKYFLLNTLLTSIIFYFLDLYTKTLRVQFEGTEKIQKHLENGGRVIMASWHQRFFGGFFLPKIFKWSPCIMISKSRDGDFISKVVSHIGWIPVRGSSSRGGKEALRAMVQGVNENQDWRPYCRRTYRPAPRHQTRPYLTGTKRECRYLSDSRFL